MKDACYLLPRRRAFCHLGKFGDEMILFPGLKHLYDETGVKPAVVVNSQFASVFDGISYAEADVTDFHWFKGVSAARQYCERKYGEAIVPKWWDDPTAGPPRHIEGDRVTRLQVHGREVVLAEKDWESYQVSQWVSCGFTRRQMLEWPLVFDRRDEGREAHLRRQCFRTRKPKLLVAISNPGTSPFAAVPEVMMVVNRYMREFEIVDVSKVMSHRIYDLLGLYDHAAGLIVNDSAPAHLAAASKVPTVWYINDGGAGSVPRGNVAATIRYRDALNKRGVLHGVLEQWKHANTDTHRLETERASSGFAYASGGGNMEVAAVA